MARRQRTVTPAASPSRIASRAIPDVTPLLVCKLGLVDYQEAWNLQRRLAEARRDDRIPDVLLLLQHPHTYTLGRRSKPENVLLTPSQLKHRKIALYDVDRGGDVTYHGPDQLVGYPILKLPPGRLDYVRYIRGVEHALLVAVESLGVEACLEDHYSGVWVKDAKVCAIGIKVDAAGVTTHGFALNVNTDLQFFEHIVPCGIRDRGVTSLQQVLGRRVSMDRVVKIVTRSLATEFQVRLHTTSAGKLNNLLDRAGPFA